MSRLALTADSVGAALMGAKSGSILFALKRLENASQTQPKAAPQPTDSSEDPKNIVDKLVKLRLSHDCQVYER
jgi:hypothetical protein